MRRECGDDDPFISSTPYGNKVFLHPWITNERKGDWYYNRHYCAQNCAEMVTIHSSAENEIFHEFMRSVGMVHPGTWLGGQIREKQEMRNWYDGVEVTFMKKAPGEFNENGLTCLDAGWDTAQTWWRNWHCTGDISNRHLVACQRQAPSTT